MLFPHRIAARCGKLAGYLVIKSALADRRLMHRLPQPQVLRHATRMTIAAVLTFAAAWAFALPQSYRAVISAIVAMQGSLGGTLGASLDRLMATVAGAMVGAACVSLRGRGSLPEILVLTLAVGPTALLAALRPSFRLAPITAVNRACRRVARSRAADSLPSRDGDSVGMCRRGPDHRSPCTAGPGASGDRSRRAPLTC